MLIRLELLSSILFLTTTTFAVEPVTAQRAAEIVRKGGKHWSAPAKLPGIDAPRLGTFVYLWPREDRVFELRKSDNEYRAVVDFRWVRPPGTTIPKSKARNVKTHIFFHRWKGAKSVTFGNLRSIIKAKSDAGAFHINVTEIEPWEGERELEFRVMTNDRPGKPVSNFLRLKFRIESE